MPRKFSVHSLKESCLKNIAKHFDSYWFAPFEDLFGSSSRLMHVLGPFDSITSELNRDLIHCLLDQKKLKVKHFQLLLNNRLTELDLREARSVANQDKIIETIAFRCQRLLKLNLDGFNRVSPKALCNLMSNLTSLRHLSLCSTKCNDNTLETIGSSCVDLIELDISSCNMIKDKGFHVFFKSKNGEIEYFKKLILLKTTSTYVSSDTLAKIITLRKNLDIQCEETCEMINKAFGHNFVSGQEIKEIKKIDQLSIRKLSTEEEQQELTIKELELTCAYCPNLTEVILQGNFSDEYLQPLKNLLNLRKLHFSLSKYGKLSFQDGILPLLMDIGHQLFELNLHTINDVCLDSVGMCCLNLKKLGCTLPSVTSTAQVPQNIEKRMFSELIELDLSDENQTFPSCTLRTILTNAKKIKIISLCAMQSLTTELFLEVLEHNPLTFLCELQLESCHSLTREAITKLLELDNDLHICSLNYCKEIYMRDNEHFQKVIKKNKLDLVLEWF